MLYRSRAPRRFGRTEVQAVQVVGIEQFLPPPSAWPIRRMGIRVLERVVLRQGWNAF